MNLTNVFSRHNSYYIKYVVKRQFSFRYINAKMFPILGICVSLDSAACLKFKNFARKVLKPTNFGNG